MKLRAGVLALVFVLGACAKQDPAPHSTARSAPVLTTLPSAIAMPPQARDASQAIANEPNRGALISYDRRTALVRDGAFTSRKVAISEDHALRAVVTGKMNFPLPDGSNLALNYERHAESTNGNWTWVGRVEGGDRLQEAIITFGDKAVFGSIPQGRGLPNLELTTRNGALWMVQTNPVLAPAVDRSGSDTLVRTATAAIGRGTGAVATAASSARVVPMAALPASAAAGPANTVDVVLGYTSGLAGKFGGQSQAVTRMSHLVEIANQGYANSAVNGALRLVGTVQVNYTDSGTNQAALVALTGNTGSAPATVPPALAPLITARETYGADVVALVRAYEYANEGCGIAWLLGANQQATSVAADAPFGYAIVADLPDGASAPGPNSKNYFCAKEGLAHELGHLMGSAHDRDNLNKNTDGSPQLGRYAYSLGLKTTAASGNFYTIMSYGDDGQQDYRAFSNPNITSCGGRACGVANQADNAQSLNQTIPLVAQFRASVVPPAQQASADANGDGRSDLFWHSTSAQFAQNWSMNGASYVYGIAKAVGSQYRLGGIGDINGDGQADMIWYDQSKSGTTSVYAWVANSGGTYTTAALRSYPAGWNIVGVADANGDGRADIFWHNPTSGALEYWLMNGTTITYGGARTVSNIYRVAVMGDFTGDGRADIVWTNIAKTELWMWYQTNSGVYSIIRLNHPGYPAGWDIVGSGDVNADGRADIFWHNPTSGALEYWLMNGATPTYGGARAVPTQYRVAAIGDYNGDGRSDLVWRNEARSELWMWVSSTTGAFSIVPLPFPGGYPAGWEIIPATRPPA